MRRSDALRRTQQIFGARLVADALDPRRRLGIDTCLVAEVEPLVSRGHRLLLVMVPDGHGPAAEAHAIASRHDGQPMAEPVSNEATASVIRFDSKALAR